MEELNDKILNAIGKINYNQYMLLTGGKEIDNILDSKSPVYEMYKYRSKLIDARVEQNFNITINNLKKSLEETFQEYLSDKKFKIVKDILLNHKYGWSIDRLIEIHKQHRYYRIFRLLNTSYENWMY